MDSVSYLRALYSPLQTVLLTLSQKGWYKGSSGLYLISSTGIGEVEDCISTTDPRTVQESRVSIDLLLGLHRTSRTGTGTVEDYIISVGLVVGHK